MTVRSWKVAYFESPIITMKYPSLEERIILQDSPRILQKMVILQDSGRTIVILQNLSEIAIEIPILKKVQNSARIFLKKWKKLFWRYFKLTCTFRCGKRNSKKIIRALKGIAFKKEKSWPLTFENVIERKQQGKESTTNNRFR